MRATLQQVNANGSAGLYDWYIGMHRTAFDQNGAWNGDFLGGGTQVMWNTPGAMYGNGGRLLWGDSDEPHAKVAAEQFRREPPYLWALSKLGSVPGL